MPARLSLVHAVALAALAGAPGEASAQSGAAASRLIDRPGDIAGQVAKCWLVPGSQRGRKVEASVRVSFRADGALLGPPLITYINAPAGSAMRADIATSIKKALAFCTPLPFTAALGSAIAGRMIVLRFISNPEISPKETPI